MLQGAAESRPFFFASVSLLLCVSLHVSMCPLLAHIFSQGHPLTRPLPRFDADRHLFHSSGPGFHAAGHRCLWGAEVPFDRLPLFFFVWGSSFALLVFFFAFFFIF